jgi:hypothetical protein
VGKGDTDGDAAANAGTGDEEVDADLAQGLMGDDEEEAESGWLNRYNRESKLEEKGVGPLGSAAVVAAAASTDTPMGVDLFASETWERWAIRRRTFEAFDHKWPREADCQFHTKCMHLYTAPSALLWT